MPQQKLLLETEKKLNNKKKKDVEKIEDLIIDGTLDPYKIEEYKYVKEVASKLDWPVHRTFQAIERAKVKEAVKNELYNRTEVTIQSPVFSTGDTGNEESKGKTNE